MMSRCAAMLLALITGGCSAPAPTYPWRGSESALRQLHDNAAAIRTIQSSARVILERPDGQTARLDAALLAEFPGRLRLRAWKLGQPVFDLTLTPDGLWLAARESAASPDHAIPAAGFARAWSLFAPEFFLAPSAIPPDAGGRTFTVERPSSPSAPGTIVCEVERATLRPIRYTVRDESGATRSTVTLDRYRNYSGTFWPGRITAAGEGGIVTILIDTAHFNEALPESAFRPPAAAVKQP